MDPIRSIRFPVFGLINLLVHLMIKWFPDNIFLLLSVVTSSALSSPVETSTPKQEDGQARNNIIHRLNFHLFFANLCK